jgi:NAD-dependent dihydropyrimidine dehydrogenase PreA subunit
MKYSLSNESQHIQTLITGHVVPEPERCIQCGICSFSCPIGIDVRLHAWSGDYIEDPHCLTCGECIEHCPRSVLHFEKTELFGEAEP